MTDAGDPWFFVAQINAGQDRSGVTGAISASARDHQGTVLANAPAGTVECLEPGTPAASIILVRFTQESHGRQFWLDPRVQAKLGTAARHPGTVCLLVQGLPYEGLPNLPDIPTIASVTPPRDRGPTAYMLVQGTGTDPARMDQYRDIILPIIKEQGAYYIVFDIEGRLQVLGGEWPHQIFAISQWPDHAAGHAFWDSDRYQTVAIPIRKGHGNFLVHFFQSAADL